MPQHRNRPRTRGELDLTRIDGEPSPGANEAYARQKSDIEFRASTIVGRFETVLRNVEPTMMTAISCGTTVIPALLTALVINYIGLTPGTTAFIAGLVWAVTLFSTIYLISRSHRRD